MNDSIYLVNSFFSLVKSSGGVKYIVLSSGGVGPLHGKKMTGPKVVLLADSLLFYPRENRKFFSTTNSDLEKSGVG